MRIEKIAYDETLMPRNYCGKWIEMLNDLPPNQMLRISDLENPLKQQLSILGCFRHYRRRKKALPFKVHTARKKQILYVWKEEEKCPM